MAAKARMAELIARDLAIVKRIMPSHTVIRDNGTPTLRFKLRRRTPDALATVARQLGERFGAPTRWGSRVVITRPWGRIFVTLEARQGVPSDVKLEANRGANLHFRNATLKLVREKSG